MNEIPQLQFYLPEQFSNNNLENRLESFSQLLSIDQPSLQNCSIPDSIQDEEVYLY